MQQAPLVYATANDTTLLRRSDLAVAGPGTPACAAGREARVYGESNKLAGGDGALGVLLRRFADPTTRDDACAAGLRARRGPGRPGERKGSEHEV